MSWPWVAAIALACLLLGGLIAYLVLGLWLAKGLRP
jgi:hypothetical protein